LILQPLVAALIGFLDGCKDVATNKPPFLVYLISERGSLREKLRQGLQSIQKPLFMGVILGAIVKYSLFNSLRILGALIIGILLVALPYALSRGICNRIISGKNLQ
jgi:hypothetical protein